MTINYKLRVSTVKADRTGHTFCLEMSVQRAMFGKRALTEFTRVRFLPSVDAYMPLQRPSFPERPLAVTTLKRHHRRMGAHVHFTRILKRQTMRKIYTSMVLQHVITTTYEMNGDLGHGSAL